VTSALTAEKEPTVMEAVPSVSHADGLPAAKPHQKLNPQYSFSKKADPQRSAFSFLHPKEENMQKEQPTKIDIVKIQMVRDGTLEYDKKAIKGPQDLAELGHKFIQNADREVFLLVCLNTRNHINCIHVVSIGTVNTALVTPREVLKVAILSNAASIAFIHNHPSGDPDPSQDDIQITNRLVECGKLFGIGLLDHVIISDDGKYESFLEKGLISKSSDPPFLQIKEQEGEHYRNQCENDRMEKKEDNTDFGQRYFRLIGCWKGLKKGKSFPYKLCRFKEFTQLMKEMALKGIEKRSEGLKKDPKDAIPNTPGDERHINFVLEDLVKKIIRFRNQRSENDMVKLALWSYLLWMKLYPKQKKGGGSL